MVGQGRGGDPTAWIAGRETHLESKGEGESQLPQSFRGLTLILEADPPWPGRKREAQRAGGLQDPPVSRSPKSAFPNK